MLGFFIVGADCVPPALTTVQAATVCLLRMNLPLLLPYTDAI